LGRFTTSIASSTDRGKIERPLMAADLIDLVSTVDCLPLAMAGLPGADAVIGNRAYGTEPDKVAGDRPRGDGRARAGRRIAVLKHIPGHGRATADTHFRLAGGQHIGKRSLERTDFAAFQPLADLPMAMTHMLCLAPLTPPNRRRLLRQSSNR